jgi:hypothetical protein
MAKKGGAKPHKITPQLSPILVNDTNGHQTLSQRSRLLFTKYGKKNIQLKKNV